MPVSVTGAGAFTGATTINGLTMPTDAIAPGMVLINKTDFTTAASVSINNCFSSVYDNYKVLLSMSASSADVLVSMRLRASQVDQSTSNYNTMRIYQTSTTTASEANPGGTTQFPIMYSFTSYANQSACYYDVLSPYLAKPTHIMGGYFYTNSGGTAYQNLNQGLNWTNTQFDGFTIYPQSGTLSGTIRIYGYRNTP